MKRAVRLLAYVGVVVLSFFVGHGFDEWLHSHLRGLPQFYVTTADVDISGGKPAWESPDVSGTTCARPSRGGIKAGTPVVVRHWGPLQTISVEFEVVGVRPPLRKVTPEEEPQLRAELACRAHSSIQ